MKKNTILGHCLILLTIVFLAQIQCLSSSQIVQKCHCDITSSFCDFGCCCDIDCGTSISASCFYGKSSFYCPKTDFFKTVKTASVYSDFCYYYNSSTTVITQKSLTSTQKSQHLSQNSQISPASSSVNSGYKGYKVSSILTIGGKNTFSFVSNTGTCLSAASTATFSLRFGQNTKISCTCNNCGTPLLFSDIMGKSIPQFLGLTGSDINIPQVNIATMTTLKLNFIIGKYGSQNVKFIDRITYSYEQASTTTRSLYINFIDSDNIKEEIISASFFPQIPIDMFYPIHIMS